MSDRHTDEEFERDQRIGRKAAELVSLALSLTKGDLDRALGEVASDDAPDVLGAVLRDLALLHATQQLREAEPPAKDEESADLAPVGDDRGMPADPWETGNAGTDAVEAGARLWQAIEAQQDVAGLLQPVGTLGHDDLALIVLERGLAAAG
jgi:hypothetical protein